MNGDISWVDAFRVLVVSGLAALAGALFVTYVAGIRARHRPRKQVMVWGASSAIVLLFIAVFDQLGRVGEPATWRLPLYVVAVICGFVAVTIGGRARRHAAAKPVAKPVAKRKPTNAKKR